MSRPDRASRDDHGTSTLEVAGLAPLVLFVAFLLVNGGLALYGISATETAAHQAARAMSLGDDPYAAADAALPDWLDPQVRTIGTGENGVRVTVDLPDMIPGTSLLVSREAVMP